MLNDDYLLTLKSLHGREIVHHFDDKLMVSSFFNRVFITSANEEISFRLPLAFYFEIFGQFRLIRRALRLDKCSIALTFDRKSLVITYRGTIYHYCMIQNVLSETLSLTQCNTVLHMGIASFAPNVIVLGEYGRNKVRDSVPIYLSKDGGRTWTVPYTFAAGAIRHVHGVYYDKFTNHLWVSTGDLDGECYLYEFFSLDFENPVIHGDGSQIWRTVGVFFTSESVVWAMDSEVQNSHLVTLDRVSGEICIGREFPGPIWYVKTLSDGLYLLQTTVEQGAGVLSKSAHLYISKDLADWQILGSFCHDGMPLGYFKNAVIAFSNGEQSKNKFYFSVEAVQGMDGKAYECQVTTNKKKI